MVNYEKAIKNYIDALLLDEYRKEKVFYNQISTEYDFETFLKDKGLFLPDSD